MREDDEYLWMDDIEAMCEEHGWMKPTVAPPPVESGFERERYEIMEALADACSGELDIQRARPLMSELEDHQVCVKRLHQLRGYEPPELNIEPLTDQL